ncbi:hypothetical protein [Mycolicibacterium sp. YH-1]|uniref:hypothetical protein n=1 Tax=Mycolicibacterium sp. YH-1 TaxID=2908837 RepID=UPI001F4C2EBA|nr:hypothetical protein [Mycolicibacterium sp. YH-1]UNB53145.1 hypothetical protein L0M16_01855 [Mycolicibacterium sp. YH-1]
MTAERFNPELTQDDVRALARAARVQVPDGRIAGLTTFANVLREELNRLTALDLGETFPAAFDARWER